MFGGKDESAVFKLVKDNTRVIWNATFWENHYALSFVHPFCASAVNIGSASGTSSVHHHADSSVNCSENRDFFNLFFSNVAKWMIWEKDARQHHIHNRSMVGNDNVSLVFIYFFSSLLNEPVAETHSEEHSHRPKTDEKVAVFIMFFSERQDIDRKKKYQGKNGSQYCHPKSPQIN
ncbi:hypothetical protein D3C86_1552570 [compost metagenome]